MCHWCMCAFSFSHIVTISNFVLVYLKCEPCVFHKDSIKNLLKHDANFLYFYLYFHDDAFVVNKSNCFLRELCQIFFKLIFVIKYPPKTWSIMYTYNLFYCESSSLSNTHRHTQTFASSSNKSIYRNFCFFFINHENQDIFEI